LHGAAARGDLAALVQEIDLRSPKEELDAQGNTPLAWAILAGQRESVRALLEEGANPNLANHVGMSPLMLAAQVGNAEVVELLLAGGARPNEGNAHGETALMLAARSGRAKAASVLVSHGVLTALRCERGMTALHHAAEASDCAEVLQSLFLPPQETEARDLQGETPLLLAVGAGHAVIAAELLARGADPNARDYHGYGAFDQLVRPRAPLAAELAQSLRAVLKVLEASNAERRLGLDPSTTPILFRAELAAIWRREGLPALPAYVQSVPKPEVVQGSPSVRLFTRVPASDSRLLPNWLLPRVLLGYRGWTRVPNIVQQVVLRGLSPRAGHRVRLCGDAAGRAPWRVDDVLLIEPINGAMRARPAFVGRAEDVLIEQRSIPRLGERGQEFTPDAIDFATVLATDGGADRVVLSVLDFGTQAELSPVYLFVEGSGARETLARVEVTVSRVGAGER
jgi:ankyrin repeat protein